jgi:hypothetical protein
MTHIADNQDALLDYLYEEGDPAERLKIAMHVQECAECSVAVLELQNVRGMLSDWTPPDARLGFRIVQDASLSAPVQSSSATVDPRARDGRSWGWGPTTTNKRWQPFLQIAAAMLLFISGMAFSQLDVQYRDGRLIVSFGNAEPEMPERTLADGRDITLPAERVSAQPASAPGPSQGTSGQAVSAEDVERLFQRVRAMIDQSEQRQKSELALRLSQVAREVDTQHQADLLRIQQDFGQQQEATMEYLVRTSGGTK